MKGAEVWRLLDLEFENPYADLVFEEAIPMQVRKGEAPNTIRFWRNMNTAVIGANARPLISAP